MNDLTPQQNNGWIPIDSVDNPPPKDDIILIWDGYEVERVWYKNEVGNFKDGKYQPGWTNGETNIYETYLGFYPTHWQPLPKPPIE